MHGKRDMHHNTNRCTCIHIYIFCVDKTYFLRPSHIYITGESGELKLVATLENNYYLIRSINEILREICNRIMKEINFGEYIYVTV